MTVRNRIGVVVADDHPVARDGIARSIKERPDLRLLGEAENGREAVALVDEVAPDVALLDIRMPGLDGLEALGALAERGSDSKVVLLSAHIDGDLVHAALSAGASGYLSKEAHRQEICDAIVAASRGEIVVDPRIQAGLLSAIHGSALRVDAVLTERELEVLRLAAEGSSTAQIADALTLSPETVKSHFKALYSKLGAGTRAEAVGIAVRRGILD